MGAQVKVSDGRVFDVKELGPGDMLDLIELAGTTSGNQAWMHMALMICSVTAIDGVPVPAPTKKADVKTWANKIGNDGLVALNTHFMGEAAEAAPIDADTAKN